MQCPVCRVNLVMSERQGIEIDYCPQCRGVWLDRGELDKIIERSAAPAPAPVAAAPRAPERPAPHDPYAHQGYQQQQPHYREKRRKSFFEELFD